MTVTKLHHARGRNQAAAECCLGSANVISLSDARAKAFELRQVAALGRNPKPVRASAKI